jgi:hypothetical protein
MLRKLIISLPLLFVTLAAAAAANGYTFESNDIIKPNGERLFQ